MYLFDTDIVTHPLKPRPQSALVTRLSALGKEQQHISTVTLGEIIYGALRSPRPSYHLARLQQLVLPRVQVLPYDADAAHRYGAIRAELERSGQPLADLDLQVAAIALSRGLTLVTGNTRHFERVPGLRVENWLAKTAPPGA
ncbi:MAG: type II toxin-antitoxin system VapC family toxin [Armatimonadetes bacterium]|nr:type II toxin-antitoxin system VapC family toxin [Armatimonadota bacterium]